MLIACIALAEVQHDIQDRTIEFLIESWIDKKHESKKTTLVFRRVSKMLKSKIHEYIIIK